MLNRENHEFVAADDEIIPTYRSRTSVYAEKRRLKNPMPKILSSATRRFTF